MNENYDAIVLGTGLKECIISGLLSVEGKKVLHVDKNLYYGGESASLNLLQLFEKFGRKEEPSENVYGGPRDYNVDLVPKFILASGVLVKMLIKTEVTKYLEFRSVSGSYVYKDKKIHKVPSSDTEAVKSSLMGLFEKRRCKKFFEFVQDFEADKPKTHGGWDLKTTPMKTVFKKFDLESETQDFIGHALALYTDDEYLEQPALPTIERVRLYCESLSRYGNSPYVYPMYGLGELPQAFARLSAIYGGTYMLNKPIDEIIYENGVAVGIKSEGEVAKAKFLVGDPSYFPTKVKKVGQVVRAIAIIDHTIHDTDKSDSCQIIIPQKQIGRKSDIYIMLVSSSHGIAASGKRIAIISTTVETSDPSKELAPAFSLLGNVIDSFTSVSDVYEPLEDGQKDKVFISTSYDATSHFESVGEDVISLYRRITGKELDLTPKDEN